MTFADDHALISNTLKQVQLLLLRLETASEAIGLHVNFKKTEHIHAVQLRKKSTLLEISKVIMTNLTVLKNTFSSFVWCYCCSYQKFAITRLINHIWDVQYTKNTKTKIIWGVDKHSLENWYINSVYTLEIKHSQGRWFPCLEIFR